MPRRSFDAPQRPTIGRELLVDPYATPASLIPACHTQRMLRLVITLATDLIVVGIRITSTKK